MKSSAIPLLVLCISAPFAICESMNNTTQSIENKNLTESNHKSNFQQSVPDVVHNSSSKKAINKAFSNKDIRLQNDESIHLPQIHYGEPHPETNHFNDMQSHIASIWRLPSEIFQSVKDMNPQASSEKRLAMVESRSFVTNPEISSVRINYIVPDKNSLSKKISSPVIENRQQYKFDIERSFRDIEGRNEPPEEIYTESKEDFGKFLEEDYRLQIEKEAEELIKKKNSMNNTNTETSSEANVNGLNSHNNNNHNSLTPVTNPSTSSEGNRPLNHNSRERERHVSANTDDGGRISNSNSYNGPENGLGHHNSHQGNIGRPVHFNSNENTEKLPLNYNSHEAIENSAADFNSNEGTGNGPASYNSYQGNYNSHEGTRNGPVNVNSNEGIMNKPNNHYSYQNNYNSPEVTGNGPAIYNSNQDLEIKPLNYKPHKETFNGPVAYNSLQGTVNKPENYYSHELPFNVPVNYHSHDGAFNGPSNYNSHGVIGNGHANYNSNPDTLKRPANYNSDQNSLNGQTKYISSGGNGKPTNNYNHHTGIGNRPIKHNFHESIGNRPINLNYNEGIVNKPMNQNIFEKYRNQNHVPNGMGGYRLINHGGKDSQIMKRPPKENSHYSIYELDFQEPYEILNPIYRYFDQNYGSFEYSGENYFLDPSISAEEYPLDLKYPKHTDEFIQPNIKINNPAHVIQPNALNILGEERNPEILKIPPKKPLCIHKPKLVSHLNNKISRPANEIPYHNHPHHVISANDDSHSSHKEHLHNTRSHNELQNTDPPKTYLNHYEHRQEYRTMSYEHHLSSSESDPHNSNQNNNQIDPVHSNYYSNEINDVSEFDPLRNTPHHEPHNIRYETGFQPILRDSVLGTSKMTLKDCKKKSQFPLNDSGEKPVSSNDAISFRTPLRTNMNVRAEDDAISSKSSQQTAPTAAKPQTAELHLSSNSSHAENKKKRSSKKHPKRKYKRVYKKSHKEKRSRRSTNRNLKTHAAVNHKKNINRRQDESEEDENEDLENNKDYFMYNTLPRAQFFEYGYRLGGPQHTQERHHITDGVHSKIQLNWKDKNGDTGEQYWEFNHDSSEGSSEDEAEKQSSENS